MLEMSAPISVLSNLFKAPQSYPIRRSLQRHKQIMTYVKRPTALQALHYMQPNYLIQRFW